MSKPFTQENARKVYLRSLCDQTSECSYAAKGLWLDLYFCMSQQNPMGVLEGGLKTFLKQKYPGLENHCDKIYESILDEITPLLNELIHKKVCVLADSIDGIPENSIVCVQLYREWKRILCASEHGRNGATVRWRRHAERIICGECEL